MGSLWFADIQPRPTEVLDVTSLTLEAFQRVVPPFEAARYAHMAEWCLDGMPRTARWRCASSTSPVVSSAVVSSTTPTACGRPMSVIWSWKCAVRCITCGCV